MMATVMSTTMPTATAISMRIIFGPDPPSAVPGGEVELGLLVTAAALVGAGFGEVELGLLVTAAALVGEGLVALALVGEDFGFWVVWGVSSNTKNEGLVTHDRTSNQEAHRSSSLVPKLVPSF